MDESTQFTPVNDLTIEPPTNFSNQLTGPQLWSIAVLVIIIYTVLIAGSMWMFGLFPGILIMLACIMLAGLIIFTAIFSNYPEDSPLQ